MERKFKKIKNKKVLRKVAEKVAKKPAEKIKSEEEGIFRHIEISDPFQNE